MRITLNVEKARIDRLIMLQKNPEKFRVSVWYYSPSSLNKWAVRSGRKKHVCDTVEAALMWLTETLDYRVEGCTCDQAWPDGHHNRGTVWDGVAWFRRLADEEGRRPIDVWELRYEIK